MKKAIIYYFSGTGNTEIIAGMFSEELPGLGYSVESIRMEDILRKRREIKTSGYDLIGIGSPIIGYGVPNVVKDFLRAFPKGRGEKVFVFRSAGGVAPINFNASNPIRKKLLGKGYDVFHERVFSISSNWIKRVDDRVVRRLAEATRRKVARMCLALTKGERRIYVTGKGLRLKMGIVRGLSSPVFRVAAKDYAVNENCTNCGLCVENCPSGNIRVKNQKVRFGLNCSCCMRCLYACPAKAIGFRLLKFFRVPGDYNIKKILKEPVEENGLVDGFVPPFSERYFVDDEL